MVTRREREKERELKREREDGAFGLR